MEIKEKLMIENKKYLVVTNSIIKIIGVFEIPANRKNINSKFTNAGYVKEVFTDPGILKHFKDYWYPDFRDVYFFRNDY